MSRSTDLYQCSDFRDLFAAACADPLDDAVRLVLADWLEEQGETDQATFIRIQIERAGLREQEPRSVILSYEESRLLNRHRRRWLSLTPEWLRPDAEFERGLPGRAELPAALLLEHAGDDWSHVLLHEIDLKDVGTLWSALFDWKGLNRVTSLNLHLAGIGSAGVKKLVASRYLSELRTLRLYKNGIGPAEAKLLAESKNLPHLTRLRLATNPLGREGIEALTSTDLLSNVTDLDLYDCNMTGPAVQALMDGPIDNLRQLRLSAHGVYVGSEGIRAIAECPRLSNLEDLDLTFNVNGDDELLILAASPYLTNLRTYGFDFIGDDESSLETLKALGRSPIMRNVIVLCPWLGCPTGDETVRVMAESPSFANVRHLILPPDSGITRVGLEALAASPYLRNVTRLDLGDNQLGDEVEVLTRLPFVGSLLKLDLDTNDLGENAARLLAGCGLVELRSLKVSRNPLGDGGIEAICESDSLPQLRELWAYDCGIGARGARALANSALASKLQSLYLPSNKLGSKGLTALVCGDWGELAWLELSDNCIKATGVKALVASKTMKLHRLGLETNAIGDDGAKHVASWPVLEGMGELTLGSNGISDAGARALIESPHRGELNEIWLDDNPAITIDLPESFRK
jgi:uncharacterized protein (TIGR02996 family)